MNPRERMISEEPIDTTSEGARFLVMRLMYFDRRGYYLSAWPETRQPGGWSSMILHHIEREPVEAAPRFNARRLAQLVPSPEAVARLRARVLAHVQKETTDATL